MLVYIHGGGYIYGNPANWPFDHWVNQSPNVVVVSVYYRLSSFGFLSTPAFRNPATGDLNAGFLDQIQALKWVKQNIARFGGDPKKVTINGESAGGASVELHIVANEKEQLFHQAIAQSVYRTPLPTPEQQQVSTLLDTKESAFKHRTFSPSSTSLQSKPVVDLEMLTLKLPVCGRLVSVHLRERKTQHLPQPCTRSI